MSEAELIAKAKELRKLEVKIEKAEAKLSEIKKERDKIRLEDIPEMMESMDITSMNIKGLGRLGVTADMRVSVKKDNQPALKEWLLDQHCGDIVKETINSSTLKAFIKSRMQDGEEVPEDLLNIYLFSRASITKS